ncbi:MAG: thioredoxin family protein [Saprospiraceae bacterium]|nr:thioredoxin family protein [Saprospiraceae bacterium]
MSLTLSNMMPLGSKAPSFLLPNTIDGLDYKFSYLKGPNGTLVVFMCNHCPYVVHIIDPLVLILHRYQTLGISSIAISSNDVSKYPQDGPTLMKELAIKHAFKFPYLYDASQDVAKAYDAACTPDFYLFDKNDMLVYRGQLDGSRPGNDVPITGIDLTNAMDNLLANTPIDLIQRPSAGCNIKWKS